MALPPALPSGYQLWYYYPSIPADVFMAAVFGILSILHLWGMIKTAKRFCIPLLVGGIFETTGYVFRAIAYNNITSTTPYAAQSILILLAPILFSASIYMYLGRVVTSTDGAEYSPIKPKFLTLVFVCGDTVCFLVQSGGGGIIASAKKASEVDLGQHIILGGLILQIVAFVFFVSVAVRFHIRMSAAKRAQAMPWQRLLYSLYVLSFFIVLRNVVRTVEYGGKSNDYLLTHEWVLLVFDGACMILVLGISCLWYRTAIGSSRQDRPESSQACLQGYQSFELRQKHST